jgi:hypothetical protein
VSYSLHFRAIFPKDSRGVFKNEQSIKVGPKGVVYSLLKLFFGRVVSAYCPPGGHMFRVIGTVDAIGQGTKFEVEDVNPFILFDGKQSKRCVCFVFSSKN